MDVERTRAIVCHLESCGARFGMVTNGTSVMENIHWLQSHRFDFIDVSIDGTEKCHDLTRGEGTFLSAKEGVAALLECGIASRLFILVSAI